ncbi:5-amino-6-(5-phospho-D-ribitylamino)uracil phosphatase YigB [Candidatus Hartigia pinicola]|nr:5-amino-6-(5-phospho-D-ribitylamino)uracil phosphatase YigB [Candidatus Hartigia pinicola]
MHFYRPLSPIKAVTFDLDDTLYDNHSIINKTEKEVLRFIREYDPQFSNFTTETLSMFRNIIKKKQPCIYHNITLWRWLSSKTMFGHYGYSSKNAKKGADDIMVHFTYWRNQINIPLSTHEILKKLVGKVPLVAITNGNAQPEVFGLARYFQFVLKAGIDGRSKPYCDMYQLAAKKLDIEPQAILHVGDNLVTDVKGAINSGMQACWFNLNNKTLIQKTNTYLLPHVEISQLSSLLLLI